MSDRYALYLQKKITSTDKPAYFWTMRLSRQGLVVLRTFPHLAYGGSDAALLMARAYRDALMRLLPPMSRRVRNSRLQRRNQSGIPGVRRFVNRYGTAYWGATLTTSQGQIGKAFSVKRYGEDGAKALAVAKREALLQAHGDAFLARDPRAAETAQACFGGLLQPGAGAVAQLQPGMDSATMASRVQALDDWFAELRPHYVHVRMGIYEWASMRCLLVALRNERDGALNLDRRVSLRARTLDGALLLAWDHVLGGLERMHGIPARRAFEERYREAFFAFVPGQTFQVRHRFEPPGHERLRRPPPALQPLLPDFEVPPLPPPPEPL